MTLARLESVVLVRGGRRLFDSIHAELHSGARIGLVGANGCGKSSPLRLWSGELEPDAGRVSRARGVTFGLLDQQPKATDTRRAREVMHTLPERLARIHARLASIEARLAEPRVYEDSERLARALTQQETALAEWMSHGGERHAARVRELLAVFGLSELDPDRRMHELSGGQRKLVTLVALAAGRPSILLLDEPDTHLDIEARSLLETFVRRYEGTVLVVSHDRYLLDACTTSIFELESGRLRIYPGNYSTYSTARSLERLHQERQRAVQDKEVARIQASIRRFEHWASLVANERHIKQARSRRRQLKRMQASEDWVGGTHRERAMQLRIAGKHGSRQALQLRSLSYGYDESSILSEVNLDVTHGERVGIVGPNGCGKSTLIRVIRGELAASSGVVRIGTGCQVGYFSQEQSELRSFEDHSPIDYLRQRASLRREEVVNRLLQLRLRYAQLDRPIRELSGGERSRLSLAQISLQEPNLLLMDEPTNHLDIASAEVLGSILERFEGSLVVASHDRYFLDQIVDRIEWLEQGRLISYPGGYTDALDHRTQENA